MERRETTAVYIIVDHVTTIDVYILAQIPANAFLPIDQLRYKECVLLSSGPGVLVPWRRSPNATAKTGFHFLAFAGGTLER